MQQPLRTDRDKGRIHLIINFTGRVYKCPKCGADMDGYIEQTCDGDEEWAGCDRCLDGWKTTDLERADREVVVFT